MAKKKQVKGKDCCNMEWKSRGAPGCGAYGLGFIGALVYYISTATSFWGGVVGFLKAIVWPAFLVYGLFKSLGA